MCKLEKIISEASPYKKEMINEVLNDCRFITGDISYKLNYEVMDELLGKVHFILGNISSKELNNIGWKYHKDKIIPNYNSNLGIKTYNHILYRINIIRYLFNV